MTLLVKLRKTLRAQKQSRNFLVHGTVGLLYIVFRFALTVKASATSDILREAVLLRIFHNRRIHQTTTLTKMDRYPIIFGACRSYFGESGNLQILSYGCSTGEEVLTLRSYFPSARIVGSEINPKCLKLCRERKVDDRIVFLDADPSRLLGESPFDAIFCMAVLQRTPHTVMADGIRNLSRIYPFEKFNAQVTELDRLLKREGLFVIHHTQYLFTDASVAGKYSAWEGAPKPTSDGPRFDLRSNLIAGTVLTPSVYLKIRD